MSFRRIAASEERTGLDALVGSWNREGGKHLEIAADGAVKIDGPPGAPAGHVILDPTSPRRLRWEVSNGSLLCIYRATSSTFTLRCDKVDFAGSFRNGSGSNTSFRREP